MAVEFLGLKNINGPLLVVEGLKGASYEELVEVVIDGKIPALAGLWIYLMM